MHILSRKDDFMHSGIVYTAGSTPALVCATERLKSAGISFSPHPCGQVTDLLYLYLPSIVKESFTAAGHCKVF